MSILDDVMGEYGFAVPKAAYDKLQEHIAARQPVAYGVPDGKGGVKFGKGWAFTKQAEKSLGATMPLYADPTAQPVDLERFRPAVMTALGLSSPYGLEREALNELLDLIESQAVGHG